MKNIINRNSKGKYHGYQERYHMGSKLWFKCFYNNDMVVDYQEFYYWISDKLEKCFYI